MVTLDFKIDRSFLAFHTFTAFRKDRYQPELYPELEAYLSQAEKLAAPLLRSSAYGLSSMSFEIEYGPLGISAGQYLKDLQSISEQLQADIVFGPILSRTQECLDLIQKEWQSNLQESVLIVEGLTGLSIEKHFDILILHPGIQPTFSRLKNRISGTYRKSKNFASTCCLWYEILADQLKKDDNENSTARGRAIAAVLDLLFCELQNRLSHSNTWQTDGGRDYQYLLPSWHEYTQSIKSSAGASGKNIHYFIEQAQTLLTERQSKHR